ncbi:alpha/beta hydrolase [Sinorhizobium meliloti]|nr:alpha/beta hydrolase [Sinorhizobium meliloti]MDW9385400.1 alpha/beta hydrolase [Sinorhizobium meliloti]MDW9407360.1 alpha/beta hydrolase [Sinorhizobium meliloti]MDW9452834.1 alpha/beta hydrolase [Sinorhizobium meliloti]MDW9465471.1 alpha/beta hydrolase [Sinorhizobium meliloti]
MTQRGNDLVNSHRVALLGLGRTPTSYIKQVRLLNFSWAVVDFLLLFCLAGCGTQHVELPTLPNTDSAASHRTQTVRSHPSSGTFDLLYITDRAPITASDSALSYGAERATFLSFGSVSIASTRKPLTSKSELRVSAVSQTGRFPATPYGVEATANGLSRSVEAVTAHDQAAASLQAEVARRLSTSDRKEVVVFVHGYGNSFDAAALTTGEICRSLQNQFVCIVLTWPAGGSGGFFFGYNIDRESSEFSVADLKKAIRIIAETQGLERLHLLAHSRGTDVLASVVQQLSIEAYVSQSSMWQRYKIANVVFFAPDIDLDVASSKMFAWISDPDLAFGNKPRPSTVPPQGPLHLTVYSSPRDKALGASTLLFGSALRLGQLAVDRLPKNRSEAASRWAGSQMGELVDFIEFPGGGFIGHSYFLSNPAVKADFIALIRDRAKAGDPRRQILEIKRPFWRVSDVQQAL